MPQHPNISCHSAHVAAGGVNSKISPVQLLDADGAPVVDGKGKMVKVAASAWLDQNKTVEQVTWAPGMPTSIGQPLGRQGWMDRTPGTYLLQSLPAADDRSWRCSYGRTVDRPRPQSLPRRC